MTRPSSPAQLALIDLPPTPATGVPARAASRRTTSWKKAQAATNARSSEQLLAVLDRLATVSHAVAQPHAAERPHPSADAPHMAIQWRAEALAELFEAIERANPGQGHEGQSNTVRRVAG